MRIFVNGTSAKYGGGLSILTNFLRTVRSVASNHQYIVAVPNKQTFADLAGGSIELVSISAARAQWRIPVLNIFTLPRLAREMRCDAILNFADIPMATNLPQVFLLDWPYAIYPESIAWRRGPYAQIITRGIKHWLLRRYIPYVRLMLVQHAGAAARAQRLFSVGQIDIVQNAISLDEKFGSVDHDFALGTGYKLLCLSHYYSHKNIEIFLEVAELIREQRFPWSIITTIDESQGPGARRFLAQISKRQLGTIIKNVGAVPMSKVPSLYRQCDALLLPTLLESFSGTYVEAMHYGKPIITSDMDFAHEVCGDAAQYCDPLDARNILEKVAEVIGSPELSEAMRSAAQARLSRLPSWTNATAAYIRAVETASHSPT